MCPFFSLPHRSPPSPSPAPPSTSLSLLWLLTSCGRSRWTTGSTNRLKNLNRICASSSLTVIATTLQIRTLLPWPGNCRSVQQYITQPSEFWFPIVSWESVSKMMTSCVSFELPVSRGFTSPCLRSASMWTSGLGLQVEHDLRSDVWLHSTVILELDSTCSSAKIKSREIVPWLCNMIVSWCNYGLTRHKKQATATCDIILSRYLGKPCVRTSRHCQIKRRKFGQANLSCEWKRREKVARHCLMLQWLDGLCVKI